MNLNLKELIRDIPDFPKKGVTFKDITPLLKSPEALGYALELLEKGVENHKIDKVVGIDSRGFIFAPLLAQRLKAGFVPVRKKGKLPYKTLQEYYALEYGVDCLEIHIDSIQKGEKVLLHDDVLATGGTAQAAKKLIERLGGELVQMNFIIHLSFLKGEEKLGNTEIKSLITY